MKFSKSRDYLNYVVYLYQFKFIFCKLVIKFTSVINRVRSKSDVTFVVVEYLLYTRIYWHIVVNCKIIVKITSIDSAIIIIYTQNLQDFYYDLTTTIKSS
jgi:hypothetical protein